MPNKSTQANYSEVDAYVKLVRTAEALHSEVSRGLVEEKITASQFSAMKALRYHGPMAQKDVASQLLKTAGNVTLVLDNLEKQGFINRVRQTDDRRLVFVSLSEHGEQTFDRLYPAHIERIKRAMNALDSSQTGALIVLLDELHTTINDPICRPSPNQSAPNSGLFVA